MTAPLEIVAVAVAAVVPSPVITTVGTEVYPVPPAVTSILSIPPAVAESLEAFWFKY